MANNYGLSDEKVAVLRNPTEEGAMKFWDYALLGEPIDATVPLAGVHRARLKWGGSTKKMVKESKRWLLDHGYRLEQ